MNCWISMAGRKKWSILSLNSTSIFLKKIRRENYVKERERILSADCLLVMELRVAGNGNSDAGHIKCSRAPQVLHPWNRRSAHRNGAVVLFNHAKRLVRLFIVFIALTIKHIDGHPYVSALTCHFDWRAVNLEPANFSIGARHRQLVSVCEESSFHALLRLFSLQPPLALKTNHIRMKRNVVVTPTLSPPDTGFLYGLYVQDPDRRNGVF